MPYFMRIVSGTGMHAGYLPGYPASHGCIRMPEVHGRKISLDQSRSEHRSRSRIRNSFGKAQYLGLQKIPGGGILMIPLRRI